MVPEVLVDHSPTPAFTTESYTLSSGSPILVLIPVAKQLGPASGGGLETPPTVSDHSMLTIVIANY